MSEKLYFKESWVTIRSEAMDVGMAIMSNILKNWRSRKYVPNARDEGGSILLLLYVLKNKYNVT